LRGSKSLIVIGQENILDNEQVMGYIFLSWELR